MTEAEWMAGDDPVAMLELFRRTDSYPVNPPFQILSDRKLRLWCSACCHHYGVDDPLDPERDQIGSPLDWALPWARVSHDASGIWNYYTERPEPDIRADLLRHIVGNPFRPWHRSGDWLVNEKGQIFFTLAGSIIRLAQALYDGADCAYALHDALLDAGQEQLGLHFKEPGHPKGCWALDLIIGKE